MLTTATLPARRTMANTASVMASRKGREQKEEAQKEDFGARLRWAIKQWEASHVEDLPQWKLAEMLTDQLRAMGVKKKVPHQTTVSDWMVHGAKPDDDTVVALANVLGVSWVWLLRGVGPKAPIDWNRLG